MIERRKFLSGAAALAAYHTLPAAAQFNGCTVGFCPGFLGGAGIPISIPSGFNRWTPPFTFTRRGSAISTNFDITTLIPAITTTYYVDPVSGNDANGGTTRGAPLQKLSTALAKSDVDQIRIINLAADFIARGTFGWNNTQPTRSLSVVVEGNFRFISCRSASSAVSSWSANGAAYQTAATTSNAAQCIDFSFKTQPTNPVTSAVLPVPPSWRVLTHVGSLAAVQATPGSWFCDNTNVYVRLSDDRAPDANFQFTSAVNNGRFPAGTNNITIYVQGVDFVGGTTPFLAGLSSSSVTGCVLALNNCSLQASSFLATAGPNGLSVQGFMSVYTYRCGAYYNCADGFNHHSFEANGTTPGTSPNFFENENYAIGNGTTGSTGTSDNATTAHDFCNGIRLNSIYANSDDGTVIDSNSSYTWNMGCYVGQAIQTAANSEDTQALLTSKMWWDTATLATGLNNQAAVASGASYYYTNMAAPSNTGPGSVSSY